MDELISLYLAFSLGTKFTFSLFAGIGTTRISECFFRALLQSQPTRCVHAGACSLPGLAGALPLDPTKTKAIGATMIRSALIKLRVTPEEKTAVEGKAISAGVSVSDYIRHALAGSRLRQTPEEKERLRQLARIGNNLNQLARWANIHKSDLETVKVLLALDSIWKELTDTAKEGTPCT